MKNRREKSGSSDRFYCHGIQENTADSDCNHEIKRCFLLGRKAMIKLHSILKSRDITLLIYVHIVKAMSFLIVMYRCKSWIIKKAECQRTDAFELWCWRRFVRVPWNADTKPTNPKEHQPWIFIERTISKAEVPLLWPPRKDWRQKKGWQRMRRLDSITNSADVSWRELWEIEKERDAWHAALRGVTESWT